jgi:hypothetical protein
MILFTVSEQLWPKERAITRDMTVWHTLVFRMLARIEAFAAFLAA